MAHRFLPRVILILTLAFLAMGRLSVLASGRPGDPGDPKPNKTETQDYTVIIVNERALAGPNSTAQLRGGRLLLPIAAIAEALGATLSADATLRTVTVRRQNGTTAIFNAPLNEVRENGAVIL